jgi:hypothetical protein
MCCLWLEGSSIFPQDGTKRFPLNTGGPPNYLQYMASHPCRFIKCRDNCTVQNGVQLFVFALIVCGTDSSLNYIETWLLQNREIA